jgi:hypothetical protein
MEFVDDITPLLITYNGIQNIERTLARLGWAKQLLVVTAAVRVAHWTCLPGTPA